MKYTGKSSLTFEWRPEGGTEPGTVISGENIPDKGKQEKMFWSPRISGIEKKISVVGKEKKRRIVEEMKTVPGTRPSTVHRPSY